MFLWCAGWVVVAALVDDHCITSHFQFKCIYWTPIAIFRPNSMTNVITSILPIINLPGIATYQPQLQIEFIFHNSYVPPLDFVACIQTFYSITFVYEYQLYQRVEKYSFSCIHMTTDRTTNVGTRFTICSHYDFR